VQKNWHEFCLTIGTPLERMKKYLEAESIELVHSGNNYFDLLEKIIDQSKEVLHLQTYIFDTDKTGLKIIEALKRARLRKVIVYVLIDAFGSFSFSKDVIKEIRDLGINFRFFSPLFSLESGYFGRRLHYKVVVADRNIALTGGINIADKYNDSANEAPWLDYAVYVNGKGCEYLHLFCERMYKKLKPDTLKLWESQLHSVNGSEISNKIRFRINDWIKQKNEIQKSYVDEIAKAKTSITIVASYFLPGRTFQKLLADASCRGVEIKIILTGKSDVSSAKEAENYLYDFYLRNKISLFEWSNSVMHAKVMIIDNKWVTIGSYNLNFLSHYISIELNTDISDAEFAQNFTKHLDDIITSGCTYIEIEKAYRKKGWLGQFKMWSYYTFFRLLMSATVSRKKK